MATYLDPEEALFRAYQEMQSNDPYASRRMFTNAAGFAPGAGVLEAIGMFPSPSGGYEPSLGQNISQGNLGSALLQLLGAGGDAALATGVLAPVGLGMKAAAQTGKALKAGSKAASKAGQGNVYSYRSSHSAPGPDFGAPLHDLTGGGQMYPADVYSSKAVQYYGTGFDQADKEAFDLARKVRGNPNAEVTMYRAVPKGVGGINAGDWVTLSKDYAKVHGESVLNGDYKIIKKKVKAKDLWTNADSIQELGYNPQ